jgi:putative heme-binding domain-containing protein
MITQSLPEELREKAAQRIGKSDFGETRVLFLLKNNKIPAVIIKDAVKSVEDSWRTSVREEALSYISVDHTPTKTRNIPTISELTSLKPTSSNGKTIFINNCASCHIVNEIGKDFGPKLSAIGSKLPKEAILESIVHPSSGIGFGYEGWTISLKDGSTIAGIISGKTENEISIKYPGGSNSKVKITDIKSKKQMEKSMMTEGLYENFSNQEMADLLEYLSALKK